ncbi:MucBP domain-containing protein, partial [Staphylococcus haemolyticus]
KDQTSDGQVGQKITVDPSDQPQQIDGYTLLPNQPKHQWLVTPTTQEKTTIYYTGDVNSHVVVHYVDANTGKTISVDRPQGHTGGALNLDDNSKIVIPD